MKDSKQKLKDPKHPRHEKVWYGLKYRGKIVGGIGNPELFELEEAKKYPKPYKIVKIRVIHEVIAEVIV